MTAIVIYLYVGQFLSKQRTAQALADLLGTAMSAGTIAGMLTRATAGLDGFLDDVRRRLAGAQVVGFDETGFRVAGKLHWLHCARSDRYTPVICHPKRGRTGMAVLGLIDALRGVAVHDAWAPYDTYLDVEHQLCCAHVQRELQAVCDTAPEGQWCWARQATDALGRIQVLVGDAVASNAEGLDETALA